MEKGGKYIMTFSVAMQAHKEGKTIVSHLKGYPDQVIPANGRDYSITTKRIVEGTWSVK
jgi:hypothetical protein